MKTIILTIFGVLCCINLGESETKYFTNTKDPAYPGKCIEHGTGITLDVGQKIKDNVKCIRVSCSANYDIKFDSCSKRNVPDNCHLSEIDSIKEYPNCCPQLVCIPKNNM